MGKLIVKSDNSGCGIYREKDGDLEVGISIGNTPNNADASEQEEVTGITPPSFCGTISPTSLSTEVGMTRSSPPYNPVASSTTSPTSDYQPDCTPIDVIISLSGTFYGFYLDLSSELAITPFYVPLGTNPGHECIHSSIGILNVFNQSPLDRINGRMSKWAFEDRKRMFLKRTEYDLDSIKPYVPNYSFDSLTFQDISLVDFGMFFPHYGFPSQTYNKFTGMGGSGSTLSGCGEQFNFIQWGREWYLLCEPTLDYSLFDTQANNCPRHSGQNIRTGLILDPVDCNNEEVQTNSNDLFRYKLNKFRYCEIGIDTVNTDDDTLIIAQNYAQNMSDNDFVSHDDPNLSNPTTVHDRLNQAGVPYEAPAGELVGAIVHDGIGDSLWATQQLFEVFKNIDEDYLTMIEGRFTRFSFGVILNTVTNKWYGCGIFRVTANDTELLTTNKVVLPEAPISEMRDSYGSGSWIWKIVSYGTSYRAFSTQPTELLYANCYTFEIYQNRQLSWDLLFSSRDYREYPITDAIAIDGPVPIARGVVGAFKEYPNAYTYGNSRKRDSTQYTYDPYITYVVETSNTGKDITVHTFPVDLESCKVGRSCLDQFLLLNGYDSVDWMTGQFYRTKAELYVEGDVQADGSFFSSPKEIEPEETLDLFGGSTELYVGSTFIADASDTGSGAHMNPFQSIIVASTFHSNSGYTCLLYTRTKTLHNTARWWELNPPDPETGADILYEKYFWLRQSLWCAVVDGTGTRIANFEVKGTLPPQNIEEGVYLYWDESVIQTGSYVDFNLQADGAIEVGSVSISTIIDGYLIHVIDDGDGNLVEQKFQHPDHENLVSSVSVGFDSGTYNITYFIAPDMDAEIVFRGNVWPFSNLLAPIHCYSELVSYFDDKTEIKSGFVRMAGHQPISPTVSISEDGHYLVVGLRIARCLASESIRLKKSSTSYLSAFYGSGTTFAKETNDMGNLGSQVLIYDMFDITSLSPTLIGKPFLMNEHKHPVETLILN